MVNSLPAMQETQVLSLGWEDPLEEEMATHYSILAWRIPWMEEPGELQSMGRKESDTTELLTYNRAAQFGQKPSGGCPRLGEAMTFRSTCLKQHVS